MPSDALERLATWLREEPESMPHVALMEYAYERHSVRLAYVYKEGEHCGDGPTLPDAIHAALDAAGAER